MAWASGSALVSIDVVTLRRARLTLIPAAGGKMPPVHFCLCISKTVRDTAMRFSDIVKDSEAVYRHIKFCHITTGNVNMAAWKPEVRFRKSAKTRVPDSKYPA